MTNGEGDMISCLDTTSRLDTPKMEPRPPPREGFGAHSWSWPSSELNCADQHI